MDNENITRFLTNLISPTLVHSESNVEALSRQAAVPTKGANLSPEQRTAMEAERNPATLYWNLPQDQREAQIRGAQALVHQYNPILWTLPSFMEQVYQRYPAYQSYEA